VVVPVAPVFITAGFHVPAIPLLEVNGNDGGVLFWQTDPIWVKVGVVWPVTTISIVVVAAHGSAGVNV
jgi:hypothetical protein